MYKSEGILQHNKNLCHYQLGINVTYLLHDPTPSESESKSDRGRTLRRYLKWFLTCGGTGNSNVNNKTPTDTEVFYFIFINTGTKLNFFCLCIPGMRCRTEINPPYVFPVVFEEALNNPRLVLKLKAYRPPTTVMYFAHMLCKLGISLWWHWGLCQKSWHLALQSPFSLAQVCGLPIVLLKDQGIRWQNSERWAIFVISFSCAGIVASWRLENLGVGSLWTPWPLLLMWQINRVRVIKESPAALSFL